MARVAHFEMQAGEPERAIAFYSQVLGWEFTEREGPQPYWFIRTGSPDEPGIDGAMIRRRGPLDGHTVLAYVCRVNVKSIDETLDRIDKAGGSVALGKMAAPGTGWIAYAHDTEGNIFALLEEDATAA